MITILKLYYRNHVTFSAYELKNVCFSWDSLLPAVYWTFVIWRYVSYCIVNKASYMISNYTICVFVGSWFILALQHNMVIKSQNKLVDLTA